MKAAIAWFRILGFIFAMIHLGHALQIPAFPGAEGYGAISMGGRGGRIIEVTNLNNSGPGSLRDACAQSGPRIVVFKVAGEIVIPGNDEIEIRNSNITIAGQTAPGDGITIRATSPNDGPCIEIVGADDVIIRYLKLRLGRGSENGDNITIRNGERIIIDHVSAQWGTDESISCTPNSEGYTVRDVTIQRCIIAETLEPHSTGSTNSRYGESDQIVDRISYHHNLWAHNNHRNPRIASHMGVTSGILSQIINNVVYNWNNRVSETKGRARTDFYGNYYKAGPMSNLDRTVIHEQLDGPGGGVLPEPSIFIDMCVRDPGFMDPTVDNWELFEFSYTGGGFDSGDPLPLEWRRNSRHQGSDAPEYDVTLDPPADAYNQLIVEQNVGCNGRLDEQGNFIKNIDRVDGDIFTHVIDGTGPTSGSQLDHQDDFGGYPSINSGIAYADTDHDGMPDVWENNNGLDPNLNDSHQYELSSIYTNIEVFINNVDKPLQYIPLVPSGLRVRSK